MNIVFLVHYFPPLNSTGARRILSFSKYLHRMGHQIHIISTVKTTKDGILSESIPDYCNLIEVSWLNRKSAAPTCDQIKDSTRDRSKWGYRLINFKRWMMGYLGQIPDHRLLFSAWFLKPALSPEVKKVCQEADVLISSCPPWPVHLAGLICALRFKKKWLADYRDQFSGNHVFIGTRLTSRFEYWIEKKMLKHADGVIAISEPMQDYYKQFNSSVYCIENGYDEELFTEQPLKKYEDNHQVLTIRYFGTISEYRVPVRFFNALMKLPEQLRNRVQVEFYGESKPAKNSVYSHYQELIPLMKFPGLVSHIDALKLMQEADALLFQETTAFAGSSSHSSRGAMSAKLFEYLAAKKPVIAEVEPDNLMGQAILKSGLSCACTLDENEMTEALTRWLTQGISIQPDDEFISQFSRKIKTQALEKAILQTLEPELQLQGSVS